MTHLKLSPLNRRLTFQYLWFNSSYRNVSVGISSRSWNVPLGSDPVSCYFHRTNSVHRFSSYTRSRSISNGVLNDKSSVGSLESWKPYRVSCNSYYGATNRRNYSSGTDPDRDNKQGPIVQGNVVGLPNPLHWLRNKLSLFVIRKYVDPSFTLEEFTLGAKQATVLLLGCLARKDFDGIAELATIQVVDNLKDFTAEWNTEQWDAVSINTTDIQFTAPKITSIKPQDGRYLVAVELMSVAFKSNSKEVALIDVTTEFEREYTLNRASDWVICNIGPMRIKLFDTQ